MNAAPPVMRLDGVTFAYHGGEPVVRDLSADVAPGKVTAIIGPNAAGKTTLLRAMLGQLRPQRGRVLLDDTPVHTIASKKRAAALAYVPQRSVVSFAFSVEQVVAMGRYALGDDARAVDEAIDTCDLGHVRRRPFAELSVGQQQRVLLARALAQVSAAGRVVLLDEPTSAMDLAHIHRVMAVLRGLAGRGLAVVVVVHDLNLAARYADRVWLMRDGALAAAGDWAEVLRRDVLEGVYGVSLVQMQPADPDEADPRPRFDVRLPHAHDTR